ncbi:MAG: hypothetical protein ACKOX6_00930 [Bdellovibrio sp.]
MLTEHNGILAAGVDSTDSLPETVGRFLAEHFIDEVPIEGLHEVMVYCKPVLEKALRLTDDYSMTDLLRIMYEGRAVLLIEWAEGKPQTCAVVSVEQLANGKAAHIMAIARFPCKTRPDIDASSLQMLAKHVKKWGCTCIQGWAQPAVARLWARIEFKEVARLVRKEL